MTQSQLESFAQCEHLNAQSDSPANASSPAFKCCGLSFKQEIETLSVNYPSDDRSKLQQVLDHHRPKRQQAFDEVMRLIDSGQIGTEAYLQTRADLEWHNEACIAAFRHYRWDGNY